MKKVNLIILIIFLAAFLRIYNLSNLPPSLNWDEVSHGYNAYSLLQTGKDEWGEFLPLSFRDYGDYKLPGYTYLDALFIATLGLNEWGVRLPSAMLGVGLVILIFLILKKLADINTALWGAFLTAITPWTIISSRIALEAQLALFLTALGFYLFLLGLEKRFFLIFSALSFGLTIFSYNSSRVVIPLLLILIGILYWKKLLDAKKYSLGALVIFLIFFAAALPKALLQDSSARYKWTSILDEGAINRINELRGSSALPPTLAVVTYNKITYAVPEILKNYFSHFTPNFLFLNGGSNYQFSVPGSGLFYPIVAPFILFGAWMIFKERKKWQLFMVVWFLIAVIPAAITRDAPHALRSLMMVPPLVVIAALGIGFCFNDLNHLSKNFKRGLGIFLIASLLINLYMFWNNYSGDYSKNYSWSWQYGYKQVGEYIKENGDKYGTIYMTKKYGEPHEFILFYTQYDPERYRDDPNLVRYFRSDWYWVDSFDKYVFLNDWEVVEKVKSEKLKVKSLLITGTGNYPEGSQKLETINFLDGKPAFDIVEF